MRMGAVLLRMVATTIKRQVLGIVTALKQKGLLRRQHIAQTVRYIIQIARRPVEMESQTLGAVSPAMVDIWIAMAMA